VLEFIVLVFVIPVPFILTVDLILSPYN
jgi:hypothetical protein